MSVVDRVPWRTALAMAREGKDEALFNLLSGQMLLSLDEVKDAVMGVRKKIVAQLFPSEAYFVSLHACGSYTNATALDGDGDLDIDLIFSDCAWRSLETNVTGDDGRGCQATAERAIRYLYTQCQSIFSEAGFVLRVPESQITRSLKLVRQGIEVDLFVKHFGKQYDSIISYGPQLCGYPYSKHKPFDGDPRKDCLQRDTATFTPKLVGIMLLKLFKKRSLTMLKSCLLSYAAKEDTLSTCKTALDVSRAIVIRLYKAINKPSCDPECLVVEGAAVMNSSGYSLDELNTLHTELQRLERDLAVTHREVQVAAYLLRIGNEAVMTNEDAWLLAEGELLAF